LSLEFGNLVLLHPIPLIHEKCEDKQQVGQIRSAPARPQCIT
jgi:hypothetical protein